LKVGEQEISNGMLIFFVQPGKTAPHCPQGSKVMVESGVLHFLQRNIPHNPNAEASVPALLGACPIIPWLLDDIAATAIRVLLFVT
jgi:hypothetical protein